MVDVTIRKWGNSLGVVLPKDFVDKHGLKESDTVRIDVKRLKGKDIMGKLKGRLGDPQQLKDLAREGWND